MATPETPPKVKKHRPPTVQGALWWLLAFFLAVIGAATYAQSRDLFGHEISVTEIPSNYLTDLPPSDIHKIRAFQISRQYDNKEFVVRFQASPAFLPRLIKKLSLAPVDVNKVDSSVWTKQPYWWTPDRHVVQVFTTRNFPNQPGNYAPGTVPNTPVGAYALLYDPPTKQYYLWGKEPF